MSELSYVFDREDGSLIWGPALHTGQFFVAAAESLSSCTRFPTGIEMLAADWCRIHTQRFSAFVSAVIEDGWHNLAYRELIRGFVVISVVLLERLGEGTAAQALADRIGIEDSFLESMRRATSQL